jgi:hypothetical protein
MTEKRNHPRKSLPVADYSSALAKAVEWLGDRYVLAIPTKSPQTLNFTTERNGGNCYEHTNANE